MSKKLFTYPGRFIQGDCINILKKYSKYIKNKVDFVFADPPYDNLLLARRALDRSGLKKDGSYVCFMYLNGINTYIKDYTNICVWTKPTSTKNTSKNYSDFIEAICVKQGEYFNNDLHWSTRTGIFTDTVTEIFYDENGEIFYWQKPFSLVEKLVLLHTPPGGIVLDLFAGTKVVKKVCDKHGFKSLSIDLNHMRNSF